jgi:hypothetical protein
MDRAYILEEIRRTAEANGGKPLGWRTFPTATGIKTSEWQEYWPRWSDALREAGFNPNALSAPYTKVELLEYYARLAKEIGHLPTDNDMRHKSKVASEFPSSATFKRFGGKEHLVQELLKYCQNKDSFKDVIQMCENYVPRKKDQLDEFTEVDSKNREIGFVYLIKSGRYYKIGKSNAVRRREYELKLQLPEKVITVHEIRTDDPNGIEAYWHKRFEGKRKNGEWFELNATDIAAFKRWQKLV